MNVAIISHPGLGRIRTAMPACVRLSTLAMLSAVATFRDRPGLTIGISLVGIVDSLLKGATRILTARVFPVEYGRRDTGGAIE